MNANEKASTADGRRLTQMSSADEPAAPRRQLSCVEIQSIRVHSQPVRRSIGSASWLSSTPAKSDPFVVATILLLSAGMLTQPASAGPFDALKNFFVRPQPQAHVTHHRPAHPKEAKDAPKDAPNDSPSPVAPPVDQQTNQQPNGAPQQQNTGPQNTGQQNTLNNNNRPGRPALAAAPLF
jgi:outer membrane biosynthesis protein TonB